MPETHLRFDTLDDIVAFAEGLDPDSVTASGNWTPGEVLDHVSRLIDLSRAGFGGARAPFLLRILGPRLKKGALAKTIRGGFKIPDSLSRLLTPTPGIEFRTALADLRTRVDQANREKMTQRSPLFGPLTHEEWVALHCRHAELHFGFLESA